MRTREANGSLTAVTALSKNFAYRQAKIGAGIAGSGRAGVLFDTKTAERGAVGP